MSKIPRMQVGYYDEDRAPDVVPVGQWELTLAERKFGAGAIGAGSLDALTFAVFLAARRAGLVPEGMGYDGWGQGVATITEIPAGESPTSLGD